MMYLGMLPLPRRKFHQYEWFCSHAIHIFGFAFEVMFYGWYHRKSPWNQPPFGRICLTYFWSTFSASSSICFDILKQTPWKETSQWHSLHGPCGMQKVASTQTFEGMNREHLHLKALKDLLFGFATRSGGIWESPKSHLFIRKCFLIILALPNLKALRVLCLSLWRCILTKKPWKFAKGQTQKTTSTSGGTLIPAGRIKAENCARSKFQGHAWTRLERRIWESVSPSPDLWHSENVSCMLVTPKTLFKGFSFTVNCKNMTHLELLFCFCESACIADAPKQIQEVHEMDLEKPWESGPKTSNPQTTEMREFQHVAQEVHDSGFSPGFPQVFHMSTMKQAKLHWSFYGGFFLSKTSPLHTIQVTAQLPKWRHSKQCWLRSSWQGWMGT